MKKQELIHIHGLLAEVQNQYEIQGSHSTNCSEYEQLGVNPTSIHQSKTAHQEAIFALLDGLTDMMSLKEEQLSGTV